MVKNHHMLLEKLLYINFRIDVLPIRDSKSLADLKKLILLDPLLTCTLVILLRHAIAKSTLSLQDLARLIIFVEEA